MIFDVWCSARGEPGGVMTWGSDHTREDVPAGKPTWHQHSPDNFDLRAYAYAFTLGEFGQQLGPFGITSDGCTNLGTRWYPQSGSVQFDLVLPLYNWFDGSYHPMTPEFYVGTVGFKASSGSLGIDITLVFGKPSVNYDVLLWYDYGTGGWYWDIGDLGTDGSGRGSASITYGLSPGTYILGLDLYWHTGGWQEILSAGNGLYGLQNSITIP
jgi:hypothetical protein